MRALHVRPEAELDMFEAAILRRFHLASSSLWCPRMRWTGGHDPRVTRVTPQNGGLGGPHVSRQYARAAVAKSAIVLAKA